MVRGVVVAALQIVEAGFVVVNIASVSQRVAVDQAGRGGGAAGGGMGGYVAPCVVGVVAVRFDRVACRVAVGIRYCCTTENHHHVALQVRRVIVSAEGRSAVLGVADRERASRFIIAEIHDNLVTAAHEALAHQFAAECHIVMRHAVDDLLRADAVSVIGVGCGLSACGDTCELPPLFPYQTAKGLLAVVVCQRVAAAVIGDRRAVDFHQKVYPLTVAVGVGFGRRAAPDALRFGQNIPRRVIGVINRIADSAGITLRDKLILIVVAVGHICCTRAVCRQLQRFRRGLDIAERIIGVAGVQHQGTAVQLKLPPFVSSLKGKNVSPHFGCSQNIYK